MSGGKSLEEAYESIKKRVVSDETLQEEEEEMEFSMGKLIRQASLSKTNSNTMPTPKGATSASSSKMTVRELETQKSLVSQQFENMGMSKAVHQKVIVQEKSRLRRTQSWAPPVPVKRSSEEDIKTQIKFWARAVATNVRPEC